MKKIISSLTALALSISMIPNPMNVSAATEQWSWPVPATTSNTTYSGHGARDIAVGGSNVEILASRSGTVVYSEPTACTHLNSGVGHNCIDGNPNGTGTYGNFITLKHVDDNGTIWYSYYAHLAYNTIRLYLRSGTS